MKTKVSNVQDCVQCPHCHSLYDARSDVWVTYTEHVEVALHTLCPKCLRAYVLHMSKFDPEYTMTHGEILPEKLLTADEMDALIKTRNPGWKK